MKDNLSFEGLSHEEALKLFREKLYGGYFNRKPKVAVVTVPVSDAVAEVVKANPDSVRISATRSDGVSVFERPRPSANVTVMVNEVREVDADGRPIWDRQGAVSDYDPHSKL